MTINDVPGWLRERRRALGLRQDAVEEATARAGEHARVTQSYLSKLERGVRPLSSLTPARQDALRRALELSASEWAARSGLGALLVPIGVESHPKKGWMILYRCARCGFTGRNKAALDDPLQPDDYALLVALSARPGGPAR